MGAVTHGGFPLPSDIFSPRRSRSACTDAYAVVERRARRQQDSAHFSLADYKAAQWEDGGEIAEQELLARDIPGCIGCAHYGYGALCADDYGVRSCLSEAVMSE